MVQCDPAPQRILVTGASGFVGAPLCREIESLGHCVVRGVRAQSLGELQYAVGDINNRTVWAPALEGCASVVHLAARVHVMRDRSVDPLAAFRAVNVDGTLSLAKAAVDAGVRRFIYLSSVKIHGEETQRGSPFRHDDPANPLEPYSISKWEAECGLAEIAARTGLEVVVLRPPLIYGPRVRGNFRSLVRLVSSGVPIPLGGVTENRRSLLALDNLIDLIILCLQHPAAANSTFLVSDGHAMSTAELISRLAAALSLSARLLVVPVPVLAGVAKLIGLDRMAARLLCNLEVDVDYTQRTLDWVPPVSVDDALRQLVI